MTTKKTLGAATNAASAANEFLRLSWEDKGFPPVTQMKLQKLIFYAHAWYLALHNTPLFEEDVGAWEWGPVIRDVYFQTRDYGRAPVTGFVNRLEAAPGGNILDARFQTPHIGDEKLKAFIRQVWDTHKKFTAVQLSNSTHAPGEPWTIIREKYGSLDQKPTIPNDLIAQVFKKKLSNEQASATSKAAADKMAAELAGVSLLPAGYGVPAMSGLSTGGPQALSHDSLKTKVLRFLAQNKLPDWIDDHLQESNRHVGYIDPDIAAKRSWSFAVKVATQRQRNIQRAKRDLLEGPRRGLRSREFEQTWGVWI